MISKKETRTFYIATIRGKIVKYPPFSCWVVSLLLTSTSISCGSAFTAFSQQLEDLRENEIKVTRTPLSQKLSIQGEVSGLPLDWLTRGSRSLSLFDSKGSFIDKEIKINDGKFSTTIEVKEKGPIFFEVVIGYSPIERSLPFILLRGHLDPPFPSGKSVYLVLRAFPSVFSISFPSSLKNPGVRIRGKTRKDNVDQPSLIKKRSLWNFPRIGFALPSGCCEKTVIGLPLGEYEVRVLDGQKIISQRTILLK